MPGKKLKQGATHNGTASNYVDAHGSDAGYRYGFQGQEMDDEVKGKGNSVNYKYRMHDPRVGRFFAVDPLTAEYSYYSPYQFSGNKVISHKELEGLEEFIAYKKDGQYILSWDVSARDRKGEAGTIIYYDTDGNIEGKMHALTETEMSYPFIESRLKMSIKSPGVVHSQDGTDESQGHPSTGFKTAGGKLSFGSPAPLDFNEPPKPKESSKPYNPSSKIVTEYKKYDLLGGWHTYINGNEEEIKSLSNYSFIDLKNTVEGQINEIKEGVKSLRESTPEGTERTIYKVVVHINERASAYQKSYVKEQIKSQFSSGQVEFKEYDYGKLLTGNVSLYHRDKTSVE